MLGEKSAENHKIKSDFDPSGFCMEDLILAASSETEIPRYLLYIDLQAVLSMITYYNRESV